ncbi:MAG: bacteriohopanetetrol glucosamine biosynthesis glycosyltransferase HpnI [Steroidobacteraceae bacterium]
MIAIACGIAVTSVAMAYAIMAAAATMRRRHTRRYQGLRHVSGAFAAPAVTVLKPLCGAEPQLYECLRSFCDQAYPCFQIVLGVRDPGDPAVAIVRRLQREYPHREIALIVDPTEHGSSLKVSNLINMFPAARHDTLVISDSDVRVPAEYLGQVVAPLENPAVGIVTCGYRGVPRGGPWSVLLAAFVNDWFMPSVYVAAALGARDFVSGVTIALRRDALAAAGGFEAIADQLPDDYRLGELTRARGLATVLSDVIVETELDERSARELIRHELRWLRTIRAVRPGGYASAFVTFALPVAVLGALLAAWAEAALAMLAVTALARLLLHFDARPKGTAALELWVLPVSDTLAFTLWCWGFLSRRVHWRQARYRVARDGSVEPIA